MVEIPPFLWEKFANIKLLAMDVDGVLTDGRIVMHPDGSESKNFHVHDGGWIRIWKRMGFKTAIITGRECPAVDYRARQLVTDYIYQKVWEKLPVFEQLMEESELRAEQIAFVGDDAMDDI